MTGGGLFILVAYGSQNVILSGNPDFTYFYLVLKKYSHFAFESVTLPLEGPSEPFFSEPIQLRAKIQRIGDLLSELYFTFTLPDIYSKYVDSTTTGRPSQYEFHWNRYIGAQIIQKASFLVGGTLVQEFDSDYLIATAQTDQDETQYAKWRELVGDVPEIYDPANGQYSGIRPGTSPTRSTGVYPNVYQVSNVSVQTNNPSIPSRQITVPLSFWFCQSPSLALPLTALQYHECEVQLTLRPIQNLYTILDASGYRVRPETRVLSSRTQIQSGNLSYTASSASENYIRNYLTDWGFTVPALNTWNLNASLQATYVYLTDEERKTFATQPLNYIVRQVTPYTFPSISSRQLFELFTHNPVTRLVIIPRRNDMIPYLNMWTNYTNWYTSNAPYLPSPFIPPEGSSGLLLAGSQEDIIRSLRILCDGNEIQELKPTQYFHELSSWKYASGVFPKGLSIYSFALDTSNWMKPSGTLNTSRVKKFQIDVDPWPLALNTRYLYDFIIYVESLNFFVVEGGMGGMKYAT